VTYFSESGQFARKAMVKNITGKVGNLALPWKD